MQAVKTHQHRWLLTSTGARHLCASIRHRHSIACLAPYTQASGLTGEAFFRKRLRYNDHLHIKDITVAPDNDNGRPTFALRATAWHARTVEDSENLSLVIRYRRPLSSTPPVASGASRWIVRVERIERPNQEPCAHSLAPQYPLSTLIHGLAAEATGNPRAGARSYGGECSIHALAREATESASLFVASVTTHSKTISARPPAPELVPRTVPDFPHYDCTTKLCHCLSGSAKAASPGSSLTLCRRTPSSEQRKLAVLPTRYLGLPWVFRVSDFLQASRYAPIYIGVQALATPRQVGIWVLGVAS
jgi:hypothetical protein